MKKEDILPEDDETTKFYKNLDGEKKTKYGVMAKRIIDISRCFYLIDKGYKVSYKKYCDFALTPENHLIIVNNVWYLSIIP